jgi:hypothetical protein
MKNPLKLASKTMLEPAGLKYRKYKAYLMEKERG